LEELLSYLGGRTGIEETVVETGSGLYCVLRPASAEALLDDADFDRDERIPYWAELWPSAIALAGCLGRMQLAGRRLVELGCGVGLATVAALAGGADVLATDYYEAALAFTRENALRNTGSAPRTMLLDWRRPPRDLPRFELVVAADVLYERENARLLAGLVPRLVASGGEAIVSDPGRKNSAYFLEEMERAGFERETHPLEAEGAEILLHHFRRPPKPVPPRGAGYPS